MAPADLLGSDGAVRVGREIVVGLVEARLVLLGNLGHPELLGLLVPPGQDFLVQVVGEAQRLAVEDEQLVACAAGVLVALVEVLEGLRQRLLVLPVAVVADIVRQRLAVVREVPAHGAQVGDDLRHALLGDVVAHEIPQLLVQLSELVVSEHEPLAGLVDRVVAAQAAVETVCHAGNVPSVEVLEHVRGPDDPRLPLVRPHPVLEEVLELLHEREQADWDPGLEPLRAELPLPEVVVQRLGGAPAELAGKALVLVLQLPVAGLALVEPERLDGEGGVDGQNCEAVLVGLRPIVRRHHVVGDVGAGIALDEPDVEEQPFDGGLDHVAVDDLRGLRREHFFLLAERPSCDGQLKPRPIGRSCPLEQEGGNEFLITNF